MTGVAPPSPAFTRHLEAAMAEPRFPSGDLPPNGDLALVGVLNKFMMDGLVGVAAYWNSSGGTNSSKGSFAPPLASSSPSLPLPSSASSWSRFAVTCFISSVVAAVTESSDLSVHSLNFFSCLPVTTGDRSRPASSFTLSLASPSSASSSSSSTSDPSSFTTPP